MTPNPQDSAVALEVERAIRQALDAETTRGPWQAKRLANYNEPGWVILWPDNTKPGTHMRRLDYAGNVTEADAHLIAACNPEAMRSLLAEIDRLRASQSDGASGEEPMELALCESQRLVLRIGQTYRFVPMAGCKTCEAMAAQANDAYGYDHGDPNQGENHVG